MTSPVRIQSPKPICYLSLVSPPVAYWLNVRIFPALLQDQFRGDTHPLPPTRPRHRRAAEQRDELATPHHSITSSARARSVGGNSSPSALAVLRLTINSTFTNC